LLLFRWFSSRITNDTRSGIILVFINIRALASVSIKSTP